jgi:hypothetical protein
LYFVPVIQVTSTVGSGHCALSRLSDSRAHARLHA